MDLTQQIILMIGSNDKVLDTINMIYREKSSYYYEIYQGCPYKNDHMFELFPSKYLTYFEKTAGIVCDDLSKGTTLKIERLIKKGWSNLYKTVKNHNRIDYNLLTKAVMDGVSLDELSVQTMERFGGYHLTINYIIFIFLVEIFQKQDIPDISIVKESIYKQYEQELNTLNCKYGEYDTSNPVDLSLVYNMEEFSLYELINKIYYSELNAQSIHMDEMIRKEELEKEGKTDIFLIEFFSNIIQNSGYHEMKLLDVLDKVEVARFVDMFTFVYDQSKVQQRFSKTDLLIPCIYIVSLMREYNYLLENYRANAEDLQEYINSKAIIKLQEQEKNFDKLLHENNLEVKQLNAHLKLQKELVDKQENELNLLRKQLELYQQKLMQQEESIVELANLRTFVFEAENKVYPNVEEQGAISYLNNIKYKVLIVGGHPNWVKLLKGELNKDIFTFLEIDKVQKIDLPSLNKKYKKIIFNTSYNSHAIYYKIISRITDKNKICYMNDSGNKEQTFNKLILLLK